MKETMKKLKNKKGFTLVELIVVLVILAILAALLVPALTGYIDRARKQQVVSETRNVLMATQAVVSEKYGTGALTKTTALGTLSSPGTAAGTFAGEITKLGEVKSAWHYTAVLSTDDGKVGQVTKFFFWDGSYGCYYNDGQYYTGTETDVPTAALPAERSDKVVWAG